MHPSKEVMKRCMYISKAEINKNKNILSFLSMYVLVRVMKVN